MKDPGLQSMQFWKWKFFKWISSRIWKLVECVLTCYIFLTKTKRRKQTCSRRFVSNSDSWRSMSALGWRKNKNSRSPSALSVINARAVLAVESNRTPELSTLFRFKMSDSMYPKSSSPSWENMPRKLKLELWLDKKHGFMDTKIVHDIKKKKQGTEILQRPVYCEITKFHLAKSLTKFQLKWNLYDKSMQFQFKFHLPNALNTK